MKIIMSFVLTFILVPNVCSQQKDSLVIEAIKNYSKASENFKKGILDSAYFYLKKAEENYIYIKDTVNTAKILKNIALIQQKERDFIGSEKSTIDALHYFELLNKPQSIADLYDRLGILSKAQYQYKDAIKYYQKSLDIRKTLKNKQYLEIASLNNIGIVYKSMGSYSKAIAYFNKALNYDSIALKYPKKYARLIDNKAYANILSGKIMDDFLEELLESLSIRKKINDTSGIIICNIHIANYYKKKGLLNKALPFAKEALALARTTNNDDFIESLLAIAEIDTKNASTYFKEYTQLNDKLLLRERSFKNTSAKIKYETEKKEQENNKLKSEAIHQKKKTTMLYTALGGLSVFLLGGFFFFRERQKTQKQQLIIEKLEAKEEERNRLSGNVHDSLAGYLRTAMTRVDNLNKELKNDELDKVGDTIELAYNKARTISKEYQKLDFKKISFEKYIKSLIIEREEMYAIQINENNINSIEWSAISPEIKTEFYRILQEALLNIHKHANAKNVEIGFSSSKKSIEMSIKDDGIGMDISQNFKSVGLSNMQSRIQDLNGKMRVDSSPTKGFELIVSAPV